MSHLAIEYNTNGRLPGLKVRTYCTETGLSAPTRSVETFSSPITLLSCFVANWLRFIGNVLLWCVELKRLSCMIPVFLTARGKALFNFFFLRCKLGRTSLEMEDISVPTRRFLLKWAGQLLGHSSESPGNWLLLAFCTIYYFRRNRWHMKPSIPVTLILKTR